ncbi:MAG: thioredoxin domain-containing protein, partial [Deltaproteobacteria bacterium]
MARLVAALGVVASCASMREGNAPTVNAPSGAAPVALAARAPQRDSALIPVGDSPRRGPDDALVTVVEFADFECPYCGRVEPTLRALAAQYGADIRFVWKDSPLPSHHRAPLAAEAAREAYAQRGSEGFFAMHDLLFANQRLIELDDLVSYAEQLGLDVPRFRSALEQHVHADAVSADVALARVLHVTGTPAFAINGTWITGARPRREFVAAIDAVLARARAMTTR